VNATLIGTAAALALVGLALTVTGQSSRATVFPAWRVAALPPGKGLEVRQFPSPTSAVQAVYPAGAPLQMTGRCTGGLHLLDLAGRPARRQKEIVRGQWCQVWHAPRRDGVFVAGWVPGRWMAPG
jgi:hypothetical protein